MNLPITLLALLIAAGAEPARDSAADSAATTADVAKSQLLLIDEPASSVSFSIGVLWLMRRHGQFHGMQGEVQIEADGGARIEVRIPAASASMKDPDHLALLRSPDYFDVLEHPWIVFRSDRFTLSPAPRAQAIRGRLQLRGVEREVEFSVRPEHCDLVAGAEPCRLQVSGQIRRSRFGMVANRRTLADHVHLEMEVQLLPIAGAGSAH